ncbi:hypothetical protein BAUCODRAFT_369939 [Baudoinia panamericana UAMH 10762]|uniref:Uncharacterized protein n=1 Tax=Baudoinia panamericana (strain UAMH 10762) TaxID=717646 RepID=M2MTJ1_BAUPA|nr:uncharacterized protein BAUCODRAFT_369939 [Baudoinia panamericana UAMH 10762]EMD00227.1 hypothetical protein BAUCODRAFT_369939 [Baudoinia panamericana UAMH 10762]
MADPPSYRKHSTLEEMTPEERLRSLQEYAEGKKYVTPGEDGTMNVGMNGMRALAFGGAMYQSNTYDTPLPPPSYGEPSQVSSSKKPGPVKKWLNKQREKKQAKAADKEAKAGRSRDTAEPADG